MTITSPYGEATPADPAVILTVDDLLPKLRLNVCTLIEAGQIAAAFEALREHVAELKKQPDANDFESLRQNRDSWHRATDAAEAHMAALAGALEEARPVVFYATDPTHQSAKHETRRRILSVVDAALAATPEQALERARGFEQLARDAVSDLRRYARDSGPERRMVSVQAYEKALAKLDTPGKERKKS